MNVSFLSLAYIELKEAVDYYNTAAQLSVNDFTTPIFMFKAGQAYEMLGQNEKALEIYKAIETEYNKSNEARKIEKYITRVNLKMNK